MKKLLTIITIAILAISSLSFARGEAQSRANGASANVPTSSTITSQIEGNIQNDLQDNSATINDELNEALNSN